MPYLFTRTDGVVGVVPGAAALRELWNAHVVLTRQFILAVEGGEPGAVTAAAGALLKNQEAIGAALGKVFGTKAQFAIALLLQEHIIDLAAYAFARFGKQDEAAEAALVLLGNNAELIAGALGALNPRWQPEEILKLLNEHLAHTKAEVDSRALGDLAGDAAAYAAALANARVIADALAAGLTPGPGGPPASPTVAIPPGP